MEELKIPQSAIRNPPVESLWAEPQLKCFTLVELLIVVGILAVLATILVPVISGGIEDARRTSCRANLHAIGKQMHMYAHDHKARLPAFESTHQNWYAIGYNNNVPDTDNVPDGSRPLFMLMYVPDGDTHRSTDYAESDAFVCPSVSDAEPDPIEYEHQVGFTSHKNISYSYQHQIRIQITGFSLNLLRSDRVIMADKNPLTAFAGATLVRGGTTCYCLENTGAAHDSMSVNHKGVGQNVLTLGGTVEWTEEVNIGPNNDTIWDPTNKTSGDFARNEVPQSKDDVFLIP